MGCALNQPIKFISNIKNLSFYNCAFFTHAVWNFSQLYRTILHPKRFDQSLWSVLRLMSTRENDIPSMTLDAVGSNTHTHTIQMATRTHGYYNNMWDARDEMRCETMCSALGDGCLVVGHVFMRHFVFGLNVALLLLLLTTLIIRQPNVHLSEWMRKVLWGYQWARGSLWLMSGYTYILINK